MPELKLVQERDRNYPICDQVVLIKRYQSLKDKHLISYWNYNRVKIRVTINHNSDFNYYEESASIWTGEKWEEVTFTPLYAIDDKKVFSGVEEMLIKDAITIIK